MTAAFQHAFYVGNNFNTILYGERHPGFEQRAETEWTFTTGIELVLYFQTLGSLLKRHRRGQELRTFPVLLYSTLLLCLNTIYVSTESFFGEEMWITHKDYPGGQDAYFSDFAAVWYQTFGTAASIVLKLCSDGLLVRESRSLFLSTTSSLAPRHTGATLYGATSVSSSSLASSTLEASVSPTFPPLVTALTLSHSKSFQPLWWQRLSLQLLEFNLAPARSPVSSQLPRRG